MYNKRANKNLSINLRKAWKRKFQSLKSSHKFKKYIYIYKSKRTNKNSKSFDKFKKENFKVQSLISFQEKFKINL